jgi:glycogen debranching enzyme
MGEAERRTGLAVPAEVRERLRQLLQHNTQEGYSHLLNRHYCYVAPALGTYPYQWFWDACFHAIMLARLGEFDLAKRNLRSLFEMQEDNGFVGHMIFWRRALPHYIADITQARPSLRAIRPHMSALVQPAVAAQALLVLFDCCGDRVFLGELYAKVRRYHEWLAAHRDFDGDGLLSIISPFESGMDWKPTYDPVLGHASRRTPPRMNSSSLYWRVMAVDASNFLRGYDLPRIRRRARFIVKDAGFNAIYARDLHAMELLARAIGDDPQPFARRRLQVARSMVEVLYDRERQAFLDVQEPGSRKIPVFTPTIFFPLGVDLIPQAIAEAVVARHLRPGGPFDVSWPLPSVDVQDPSFHRGETLFLWRGPTWAFTNWYLYKAFSARGMNEPAERLKASLLGLVARSGFREYYDPFTGEGAGAREFTWSGLLVDM